jgi:hypothetical protein
MSSSGNGKGRLTAAAIILLAGLLAFIDARDTTAGGVSAPEPAFALPASSERSSQAAEVEAKIAEVDLRRRLEVAMGGEFAGIWFDPLTARLHVGTASSAGRSSAEAVAAQTGLAEFVVLTSVRSTWAQLEGAQRDWGRRLADLFERAEVQTSLAPDLNSVQVKLGSLVPPARRDALERVAAADDVRVSVLVVERADLGAEPITRCAKFSPKKAHCDPTIVGGVTIEGGSTGCTAGPAVTLKDRTKPADATDTFVLTAGHCVNNAGGIGEKWYAYDKNGAKKEEVGIGLSFIDAETDIGVIEMTTKFWARANDPIPVDPAVAAWDTGKETSPTVVKAAGSPIKGTKSCFSGQRSGTNCGTIVEEHLVKTVEGAKQENVFELKLEGEGKVGKGDSGAPVFTEATPSTVQGVMVAADLDPKTEEGTVGYLHSLSLAFEKLKELKKLEFELLKESNQRRHPTFTAEEYPVTFSAEDTSSEDQFTILDSTITCTERELHGTLSEPEAGKSVTSIEVIPTYGGCMDQNSLPVKYSHNGCKYKFTLQKLNGEGHYSADVDIVCPEGKPGIQFSSYTTHASATEEETECQLTIPPQSGLKSLTLTNDSGEITIDEGKLTGVKVTTQTENCDCPGMLGEDETNAAIYHVDSPLNIVGTNDEEETLQIDMAGG